MTTAPLLVTRDDALLADVLRLAAAAGTTLDVAHDAVSALRGWASASLVLVGADLAPTLAEQRPPRRDQVHLVAAGTVGDPLFRWALALGAVDVVELPAADTWVVELLTDVADGTNRLALTVGVVAGSGGVGATTFAGALALTAAARRPAVLVDLDPLGPGVDRVVGRDADPDDPGVRWDGLAGSHGRLGSRSLRDALPTIDGLAVADLGGRSGRPSRRRHGPRGAVRLPARPRRGRGRPAPRARRRHRRGGDPVRPGRAGDRCRACRPWPPRAGWRPALAPLNDRLGLVVRGSGA